MPLDPQLDPVFDAAGRAYNVDPRLLKAVAQTESSGAPGAVSPAGAEGLMQLMPDTAKGLNVINTKDPAQSIWGGAQYLAQGLDKYGDPVKALMYYHGGPDQTQWGQRTQAYPALVAGNYAQPPSRQRIAMNSSGLTGTDALAAVGQPPQQNQQVAQAGDLSDDDIINGYVSGKLSLPAGAPQLKGTPSPQPSQGSAGPGQPLVPMADPANALYPPQIRGALMGFPDGQKMLSQIIEEEKAGYQRNRDGTMSPIAGGPADPNAQYQANQAATLGKNLQTNGPAGVQNMPGAVQADANKAGAVAEAQQGPVRVTQGMQPRENRGAGSGVTYPPGSPGAQAYIDAQNRGNQLPPATTVSPSGAVEVGNVNVPPEVVHQRYEELAKLGDEAHQSRLGLYEADQLQQKLHEIGTGGPMTEYLGKLSALAKQMGVPDSIANVALPPGASVQEANKLSTDLLGAVLHQTFPQRITNTDIAAWKNTVPQANSLIEANDFLFNNIIKPKFQRGIDRYTFASGLSSSDPQLTTYYKALNDWDIAHPFNSYQIAKEFKPEASAVQGQPTNAAPSNAPPAQQGTPQFKEGDIIRNPTTGERRVRRGNDWAPLQ